MRAVGSVLLTCCSASLCLSSPSRPSPLRFITPPRALQPFRDPHSPQGHNLKASPQPTTTLIPRRRKSQFELRVPRRGSGIAAPRALIYWYCRQNMKSTGIWPGWGRRPPKSRLVCERYCPSLHGLFVCKGLEGGKRRMSGILRGKGRRLGENCGRWR